MRTDRYWLFVPSYNFIKEFPFRLASVSSGLAHKSFFMKYFKQTCFYFGKIYIAAVLVDVDVKAESRVGHS